MLRVSFKFYKSGELILSLQQGTLQSRGNNYTALTLKTSMNKQANVIFLFLFYFTCYNVLLPYHIIG